MMVRSVLPVNWAFLAPLIDSFRSTEFPWDDLSRTADDPVSLNFSISTLEIKSFMLNDPSRTALLIAVVARALRSSEELREALWPCHPHEPTQVELSFVPPMHSVPTKIQSRSHRKTVRNTNRVDLYDVWIADIRRIFIDSLPEDQQQNAITVDAMRQLEARVPGASTCVMPMVIIAQPLGANGLSRLMDLLETLLRDSAWIKMQSERTSTDHTNVDKHPSAFTVHELQLTLPNLDESTLNQLRRVRALGFAVTKVVLENAQVTSPAFQSCLAMLLKPSNGSAVTSLSCLKVVPMDGKALLDIVVVLSELLDQDATSKRCALVLDLRDVVECDVIAQVLPRISLCLLPVVRSLCCRLQDWAEASLSSIPLSRLICETWHDEPSRVHVRATVTTIDRIVQQRLETTRSLAALPVAESLRLELRFGFSFPAFHAAFLAISPGLTTLEVRVCFSSYAFTRSDIACILRSLPRLKTLLLEVTEIQDMSVFLEAYEDPARAHLRVLSISSGGSLRFVPFLEALMDTRSVAANTLCELRMGYDGSSSKFLGAVVRLLMSANETLCLLRLSEDNDTTIDLLQARVALRPCHGRPLPRPRHKAAVLSVLQQRVPASVVEKVWLYCDARRQREVFIDLQYRSAVFTEQSSLVTSLSKLSRSDVW